MTVNFFDSVGFDPTTKRLISARDGVLTYRGAEIGKNPADKEFTIYRSPATIANLAMKLNGVKLVPEHVDLDEPLPDNLAMGEIVESELIDALDKSTETTLAIANRVLLDENQETKDIQLSVGYKGQLKEHPVYDFEQVNLNPHHLAMAGKQGRCGDMCRFLDQQTPSGETEMVNFFDENGAVNLEKVMEVVNRLPEAIKAVPLAEIQKIVPQLEELLATANVGNQQNQDGQDDDKDDGFTDQQFNDALQLAVSSAIKWHSTLTDKAREFLGEEYSFADKTTEEIMRDCIATQQDATQFNDEQLSLAFKMLRPLPSNYSNFADENTKHPLDEMANKEIGQ